MILRKKIKNLFSKKKSNSKAEENKPEENKLDWSSQLPVFVKAFKKDFETVKEGVNLVDHIRSIVKNPIFKGLLYSAAEHQYREEYIDVFNDLKSWEYNSDGAHKKKVTLVEIAKFDEKFDTVLKDSQFLNAIREIISREVKKEITLFSQNITYEALRAKLIYAGIGKQVNFQWKNSKEPDYSGELSTLVPSKLKELALNIKETSLPEAKVLQLLIQEEDYRNMVLAFMLHRKILKHEDGFKLSKLIHERISPVLAKYFYLGCTKEFSAENFDALLVLKKSQKKGTVTKNEMEYFYRRFLDSESEVEINVPKYAKKDFEALLKTDISEISWNHETIQSLILAMDKNFNDTYNRVVLPDVVLEIVKKNDKLKEMILQELL